MLQNVRVTGFTISELLREIQQGEGEKLPLPPRPSTHTNRLGLKGSLLFNLFFCFCMFVNKHLTNFTGELF